MSWRSWMAAWVAVCVIVFVVKGVFDGPEDTAGLSLTIDDDDDDDDDQDNTDDADAASSRPDTSELTEVGEASASTDPVASTDERAAEQQVAEELATLIVTSRHDPEVLLENRWRINASLVEEITRRRTTWTRPAKQIAGWLSLAGLLLLLGPFWVRRRLAKRGSGSARDAWKTAPWFIVSCAAVLVVINVVSTAIIDVQKLQLGVAAFGSLSVALTDATIVLIGRGWHDGVLELFARVDVVQSNPMHSLAVFNNLWHGIAALKQSWLLEHTASLFTSLSWVVDLYGPVIAMITLVLAVRVLRSVVPDIVRYPVDALDEAKEVTSPGRFLWGVVKIVFRELRIAWWMFLFLMAFMALAVAWVRALAFPVVFIALDAGSAVLTRAADGATVPDVGIYFSALSLGLFTAFASLTSLGATGLVLSRAHWVVRHRAENKRRFRDFPAFWTLVRGVFAVIARGALASLIALACYAVVAVVAGRANAWWLAMCLVPVQVMGIVRFRIPRRMVALARIDVLALPATDAVAPEPEALAAASDDNPRPVV